MDPSNEEWAVTQFPWFFHHLPQTQISSFLWNKHHNHDMPNKYHFENILQIHSINCTSKPVSKCWTDFLKECTQNVCVKMYIPLKKTFNLKYAKTLYHNSMKVKYQTFIKRQHLWYLGWPLRHFSEQGCGNNTISVTHLRKPLHQSVSRRNV